MRAQCDAILHRGPDDSGELIDGDFGFGMRRLAIVDIAGGHQPMHSPDRRYSLVFNGEIYNFPALRRELEAHGRAFASDGDTETILAGYERWGDALWPRLDGMFAVAVWDHARRVLTLARDPIGIKPLYYTDQPAGFAFASELKALTIVPGLAFDTDPRAIDDYFRAGHIRRPRSIYRQVRTLPPGHTLTVAATGEPVLSCYWEPRYAVEPDCDEQRWVERFRETWLATVESQMVADVEVGAFLSGGVDSSAVVAAMARLADRPVRTFTIGFPDPRFDEAPHAEAIARHLGCRHTTRTIDLAAARDMLPTVARSFDEPFADPAAVPNWYVSRIAAEEVKVVLSGDGGDELFFGYKRHATERKIGALHPAVRRMAGALEAVPALPWRGANARLQRWQRSTAGAGLPDGCTRFFNRVQITSPDFRRGIFAPEVFALAPCDRALRDEYFPDPRAISDDPLEQFVFGDFALDLADRMLTKVDRTSMAQSLEVRVPLLGLPMVELALAMPAAVKLKGRRGKHVMREAIAPWLPPGVLDRRKQGFKMPLSAWFAGDFGRFAEELWHDSGVRGHGEWHAAGVDRAFAEHRAGKRDHSRFLYALAVYCLWWVDRAPVLRRASL